MDSAHWEKIQTIFHDAVQRPEAERQAFLEAACGVDGELVAQVQAMLKADVKNASILDRGLSAIAGQMVGASLDLVACREFGPYRLKRLLGEGGMGVVWLAEREDTGNEVAIKFLPHAGLSPARRERFAREIKTLAKLKHPFVARLYDAGTIADGTPWFVMEYVEGVPFAEYCRKPEHTMENRLRLFRMVCEAVQYAHGQEIIHRDLKPSNILVEHDGTPRLLDFGIAREFHSLQEPAEPTRPGLRFMSPDYAAPEWIRDGNVGFYTDVYSLGVILYEMLTGRLPFDRSKRASEAAENDNAGEHPEKPSVVSSRGADPLLASQRISSLGKSEWNDLDVLCLEAMHKDAQQRYRSAEALIRDIDHYLKGEPLDARPDTVRYRLAKFVTRNRTTVLATSMALLLTVGLAIFFTVRLAKARNTALAEAARAQSVEQFMVNLFEGGDEAAGPADDLRVVTLLERGTQDAQALNSEPEVQAELYQTLGSIYRKLGKFERADSLINSALERRRSLFGADHQEVAESLLALGLLRSDQAQLTNAEQLIRDSLAMDQRHLPRNHPAVTRAMTALGKVLQERGQYDKAIELLNQAEQIQSTNGSAKSDLATTRSELANAHFYLGHYATANRLFGQTLALHQQLYGEHHPRDAEDLKNLGFVQSQWGHYPEAERYYRQALEIDRTWYGEDHPDTANMATYVAQTLLFQGRYAEAESILEPALTATEHAYGETNPRVGLVLNEMGSVAVKLGKLDEAQADFERMAAICRTAYGEQHQMTAVALSNLANVYFEKQQYARAEQLFRDVVQRFTVAQSADHLNTGIARVKLGRTLVREKRYPDAETELLAGYEILMKQTSPTVSWLQKARQDLVALYDASNQPDKASKFRAEIAANTEPKASN